MKSEEKLEVYRCVKGAKCKWQGFQMHLGLAQGPIPSEHEPWRKSHALYCGGELKAYLLVEKPL